MLGSWISTSNIVPTESELKGGRRRARRGPASPGCHGPPVAVMMNESEKQIQKAKKAEERNFIFKIGKFSKNSDVVGALEVANHTRFFPNWF